MNRIINLLGIVVLCGIIIKLSFVFVFLFDELDNGHIVGKITGVTFAFASVWFVVKVPSRWLKLTMVALDVSIILYYYLHTLWQVPIEYSAIIVAAYSGLIVYYIGSIVNEQLKTASDSETIRLQEELNRYRADNNRRELEAELQRTRRRLAESKTPETQTVHKQKIEELEMKLEELKI